MLRIGCSPTAHSREMHTQDTEQMFMLAHQTIVFPQGCPLRPSDFRGLPDCYSAPPSCSWKPPGDLRRRPGDCRDTWKRPGHFPGFVLEAARHRPSQWHSFCFHRARYTSSRLMNGRLLDGLHGCLQKEPEKDEPSGHHGNALCAVLRHTTPTHTVSDRCGVATKKTHRRSRSTERGQLHQRTTSSCGLAISPGFHHPPRQNWLSQCGHPGCSGRKPHTTNFCLPLPKAARRVAWGFPDR